MLGVADRCQDLALASLSMRSNLGDPWATRFLELYGSSTPEADKLDYYRLLDEFF
jgi:aminoglycoside 3'-phosphotransferase-2